MITHLCEIINSYSSSLDGQMQDLKIHLLSDNFGYYVLGGDITSKASICKYIFSSPTTADCQQIPSFRNYPYCQLKITDSSFFIIGRDPAAEFDLHIYTFTFAQTSPTWSSRMVCPFNGCAVSISDAVSESSKIYSLIAYGNSYKLYLTTFLSIDGSIISSRYKSNLSCSTVYGIAKSGDYIIASIGCSAYYLFIFNIATDSVTFKNYGGNTFYGITVDSVGRFVVGGNKAGHGYISRFTIQSTPAHPEFLLASPLTMSIVPSSTDSIFLDSPQTLGSPLPQSVSTYTPSFSSVTYVQEASYTSDVSYETNDETYSTLKGTTVQVTPNLPCSSSGTTTISFSIGNYLTTAPSWVTIDSSTGELTIVAPDVSTNTEFDFYINSSVTGVTGSIQKLIKLIIAGCSLSNCSKCVSSNINKCEHCNSGYSLISDSCIYQSNTSQNSTNSSSSSNNGSNETNKVVDSINTSTISIVGATSCVAILMSLMNTSSMASLWSMVNQLQLYFLLILTRSFLPNEVISVIKGYKFALNLYDYFPIRKIEMWQSLFNNYNFDLTNTLLEIFDINSDSTIHNSYPIIITLIFIILLNVVIYFLKIILSLCANLRNTGCFINSTKWLLTKVLNFMTFIFYIRNILEFYQYMLVSSTHEIINANPSDIFRITSFIYSLIIVILFAIIILFTLYLSISAYKPLDHKHNKVGEFFIGLKSSKRSKIYATFLLLRRSLYIILLLTLTQIPSYAITIILSFLQLLFFIYICVLRPFSEKKSNLIEILNEAFFFFLLFSLIFLNSKEDWNRSLTDMYIWSLASNSMVVGIIIIGKKIIRVRKICFKGNWVIEKEVEVWVWQSILQLCNASLTNLNRGVF